jgi:ribose transport system substrate-binding protein
MPASSSSATSPPGSSASVGVAYAKAQVAKYSQLATTFTPPGPPIKGLKAKLEGKAIWYIPTFLQAPIFTADSIDIAQPLALFGATVHVCNADANPSQGSSCINEAVDSHAAGIVIDAINDSFASSAIQNAVNAHIPLVATDNDDPAGFPQSSDLTTVGIGTPEDARLAADWIIAASDGKASALYAADNSNDGTVEAAATFDEFKTQCQECSVKTATFGDLTVQNLTTAVASTLTANRSISYVDGAYDEPSGIYALQGAMTTHHQFAYVTSTGQPAGLERVAAGQQVADPGLDTDDAMWMTADALFRIVAGLPPVPHTNAIRIFTKANLPADITPAGYASGDWYTNGGFKPMYEKLWGIS